MDPLLEWCLVDKSTPKQVIKVNYLGSSIKRQPSSQMPAKQNVAAYVIDSVVLLRVQHSRATT